jgi:hypothetical protein
MHDAIMQDFTSYPPLKYVGWECVRRLVSNKTSEIRVRQSAIADCDRRHKMWGLCSRCYPRLPPVPQRPTVLSKDWDRASHVAASQIKQNYACTCLLLRTCIPSSQRSKLLAGKEETHRQSQQSHLSLAFRLLLPAAALCPIVVLQCCR